MGSPTLERSPEEAQRLFELTSLYEVARLLLGTPERAHLPFEVLTTAMGLTGARWGVFWRVSQEEDLLVPLSSCGRALSDLAPLPLSGALRDQLSRAESAVPLSEVSAHPPPWVKGFEPALLLPLASDGTLRGVICLGPNVLARPFDPPLLELLGLAGHLIAIALDREEQGATPAGLEHHTTIEGFRSESPLLERIVGSSDHVLHLYEDIVRVAPTSCTILLVGETGTGKQLVAEILHEMSPRRDGPFIEVDCSAFPETLIDSELFGHVKGAFTGATGSRRGVFELAHGGTLFLDELGNLPLQTQGRLLRVLQERRFRPIGGERTVEVDVRVIAATNSDLKARVENGSFRADLFYRIYVYPVRLLPLRERRGDIPILARHFAGQVAAANNLPSVELSAEVMERLSALHYPGNVRELGHLVERLMLKAIGKGGIKPADVEAISGEPPDRGISAGRSDSGDETERVARDALPNVSLRGSGARPGVERGRWVLEVLREHRFNLKATAEHLALVARDSPESVPLSDRSSLGYYFKGECFRILLNHDLALQESARELARGHPGLRDMAERKLRGILTTLNRECRSSGSQEGFRRALQRKLQKLPADYAEVVERLAARVWNETETGASKT